MNHRYLGSLMMAFAMLMVGCSGERDQDSATPQIAAPEPIETNDSQTDPSSSPVMPDAAVRDMDEFVGDNGGPDSEIAPEPEPEPEHANSFVRVDGVDHPLAEVQCVAIGGGSTWRVAALFDIEPRGRFYFDVRSQIDEDGQRVQRPRYPEQPTVILQWPYDGEDDPRSAEFLTANSRLSSRGGNTSDLEFSRAGSSGSIEVGLELAGIGGRAPVDRNFRRTVEYSIECP